MSYPTKKLGEVCEIKKGKKPFLRKQPIEGDLPYLIAKFLRGTKEPEYASKLDKGSVVVEKNETIIICDGSNSGDIFTGFKGILSSTMGKLITTSDIDTDYLKIFLESNFNLFNSTKKGAAIPHLDINALYNIEIPLPPLPEQKKIVKKIDELFGKTDEAQKLREEAQADAAALIPAALHQIFEKGKQKGWREQTVEEITNNVQYGYTASAKQSGNSQLLRITDIQNGQVNWDTVPFCDCDDMESYRLQNGDIVFARTGATVGKSFLINNPPKNAIFASYLIRAVVDQKKCLPELLYYFFQSTDYWGQIVGHKVGGAQPNVNGTKLKKLILPLPPVPEQKKIVAYLDSLSEKAKKLQELQQQTAEDIKALKQSILHKAFRGELVKIILCRRGDGVNALNK